MPGGLPGGKGGAWAVLELTGTLFKISIVKKVKKQHVDIIVGKLRIRFIDAG